MPKTLQTVSACNWLRTTTRMSGPWRQGGQVHGLHSPPPAAAPGVRYRRWWLWRRRGAVQLLRHIALGSKKAGRFSLLSHSGQNHPKGGRDSQWPQHPGGIRFDCPLYYSHSYSWWMWTVSGSLFDCPLYCSRSWLRMSVDLVWLSP